jgi:hypothetical protein
MFKMLKDLKVGTEETGGEDIITAEEEQAAEDTVAKIPDGNFETLDAEPGSGGGKTTTDTKFKISPIVIGGALGAVVLIYLLTKKKK